MECLQTPLIKIMLSLLLLNRSFVTSQQRACIDGLLPLAHQGSHAPLLPVGIQALLPSYQFSCDGRVHSWGVALSGRGQRGMHMQVWRPVYDEPGKYMLVGANYFNAVVRFGEKVLVLKPDRDKQISVKSGDVVGFHLQGDAHDSFRVQYRTNVTGSVVAYERYAAPASCLHLDGLSNQLTNAAPLITVYLDKTPTQSSLLASKATATPTTAMPTTATPTIATTQSVEVIYESTEVATIETPAEKFTIKTPATTTTNSETTTTTPATPTTSPATPTTTPATPTTTPAMPTDVITPLLACLVTGTVILGLVLFTLVAMLLYARVQRRGIPTIRQPEKGVVTTTTPHETDIHDNSISTTPLTENPAYGSTHNGLVASLTWLPKAKQGRLQLWKAQYYETPIISSGSAKRSQKLEGSYHHYECPTTLLASIHHYEQI